MYACLQVTATNLLTVDTEVMLPFIILNCLPHAQQLMPDSAPQAA